jgi:hypothetical protein
LHRGILILKDVKVWVACEPKHVGIYICEDLQDRNPLMQEAGRQEALGCGLVKKWARAITWFCLQPNYQEYRPDWPLLISMKHYDPTALLTIKL